MTLAHTPTVLRSREPMESDPVRGLGWALLMMLGGVFAGVMAAGWYWLPEILRGLN